MSSSPPPESPPKSKIPVWVWIAAVAILAYGMCLKADYYMDDYHFIVDSEGEKAAKWNLNLFGKVIGDPSPEADARPVTMLLPTLIFTATYKVFGDSPFANHLWNLGLHIGLCVLGYAVARRFFRLTGLCKSDETAQRAALFSALVLACHPFCSESVNYAKCIYIQLVALFSTLQCHYLLRFREDHKQTDLAKAFGAFLLALFSYPYGYPIALAQGGLIIVGLVGITPFAAFLKRTWAQGWGGRAALCGAGLVVAWMCYGMAAWYFSTYLGLQQGSRMGGHVLTQGRVFWEYVRRMVAPVGLSSDHFVPWSQSAQDTSAVIQTALVGILLLAAFVYVLRRKGLGMSALALAALLALSPLVLRFIYANEEVFVEYRAYPGMLWVAILFGAGLSALETRKAKAGVAVAGGLCLVFVLLSFQRSAKWQSSASLAEDVLARYPLNNRARTQLQSFWYDAGEYQKVLQLHQDIVGARKEIQQANASNPQGRRYDERRADKSYYESEQFAILSWAELEGSKKALARAEQVMAEIKKSQPDALTATPGAQEAAIASPLLRVIKTLEDHGPEIDRMVEERKRQQVQ